MTTKKIIDLDSPIHSLAHSHSLGVPSIKKTAGKKIIQKKLFQPLGTLAVFRHRKCGICKQEGHNRRTCKDRFVLAQDAEKNFTVEVAKSRAKVVVFKAVIFVVLFIATVYVIRSNQQMFQQMFQQMLQHMLQMNAKLLSSAKMLLSSSFSSAKKYWTLQKNTPFKFGNNTLKLFQRIKDIRLKRL